MITQVQRYAFIHAKIRARIGRLLSPQQLQLLRDARSLDEALVQLRDTQYRELIVTYEKSGDLKFAELELFKNQINRYRELVGYLNGDLRETVKAFLLHFEIENLKNAIRIYFDRTVRKRLFSKEAYYLLYTPIVNQLNIDAVVQANSAEELTEALKKSPYGQIVAREIKDVVATRSLFDLEIQLDRYYFNHLFETIKTLSRDDFAKASRIIGVEIDLHNVQWIIRWKHFYNLPLNKAMERCIPHGRYMRDTMLGELYSQQNVPIILQSLINKYSPASFGQQPQNLADVAARLTAFEFILKQIQLSEARRFLVGYPFTIGCILSYLILEDDEMVVVRRILNEHNYKQGA